MNAETLAIIAQAVIAFITLVASIVVALLVYKGSIRLAAIEADRAHREAWNSLNRLALASDENLLAADSLLPSESAPSSSVDDLRRRWLGWVLINTIATGYMAYERGWTSNPEWMYELSVRQISDVVLQDDLYEMTQIGYEPEFAAFCRAQRESRVGSAPHRRATRVKSAPPGVDRGVDLDA